MRRMIIVLRIATLILLIPILMTGCDYGIDSAVLTTGTITINPEPDSIDAPWQIIGPNTFRQAGTGDATLGIMPTGNYTLTWGTVTEWTTPSPAATTQTLAPNGVLTFMGTFVFQLGTIVIDAEPDSIDAPWQMTGPNAFSQSGTGDAAFENMPAGSYTLTWGEVADWTTPNQATVSQTLAMDGVVTFVGHYFVTGHPYGFVLISAGTFTMGSPTNERGREINETLHQVTLTHGIYVHATEVTNQQYIELAQWAYDQGYATVTGNYVNDNLDGSTRILNVIDPETSEIIFNNGIFSCTNSDHPVKYVTWYGSAAYCDWLNLQQGLSRAYDHVTWLCNGGNPYTTASYRLPTEAEWEYASRAGSTEAFANGPITYTDLCSPIDPNLDLMGWYCGNAAHWTHPVAQMMANTWGLYDMHGNLVEWCNDWMGSYGGAVTDPAGPGTSYTRVLRGGSWYSYAQFCRSACRNSTSPLSASRSIGFRPVKTAN